MMSSLLLSGLRPLLSQTETKALNYEAQKIIVFNMNKPVTKALDPGVISARMYRQLVSLQHFKHVPDLFEL
jgi:hypothetical protein